MLEGQGQLVDLLEQGSGHMRCHQVEALTHAQGGGRADDGGVAQSVRDRAGVQGQALGGVLPAPAGVPGGLLLGDGDEVGLVTNVN